MGYFSLVCILTSSTLTPAYTNLGLKNVGILKNMTELKIIYSDAVRQSSKERLEMVWPSAVPLRGYEKNMRVLTRSKQVSVATDVCYDCFDVAQITPHQRPRYPAIATGRFDRALAASGQPPAPAPCAPTHESPPVHRPAHPRRHSPNTAMRRSGRTSRRVT